MCCDNLTAQTAPTVRPFHCHCPRHLRRYFSRKEEIESVENYISELKKEVAAAEEYLKSLQGE